MAKPTGFLEFTRELPHKRPPSERVNDYKEYPVKPGRLHGPDPDPIFRPLSSHHR
ncbi:MAG TPA: hypothetical protein VLM16_00075 [Ginsengibacter sp.]|nr:hypothetical protein [Ginsengibacter sp.]